MVTVNVVVLAGTVAADPVERRMPSGDEVGHMRGPSGALNHPRAPSPAAPADSLA